MMDNPLPLGRAILERWLLETILPISVSTTPTHTHFQSIYRIEVIVPLLHAFMPLKQQRHTALYRYTRLYPFHPILFANQFLQTT